MAKEKLFSLPQTRGTFMLTGVVTGEQSEKFYEDKTTKTHKPFRSVSFGIKLSEDKAVYVGLNGMVQEAVYFIRSENKAKGVKSDTKRVPWKERYTFHEDGYRMLGVSTGVKKVTDAKGNEVNERKTLAPYDACEEIGENLKDGLSVFARGSIEYSTYNDKHQTRFTLGQVSLCKKEIDFSAEGYAPNAQFTQVIVFTGIKKEEAPPRFAVSAKIVTYNSIEDAEFYITNAELAGLFRKKLKPYTAIKVWGDILVEHDTQPAEDEADVWGTENKMERVGSPTKRLLVITGADPSTIDTDTYSEENIDEAIAKIAAAKQAQEDYGGKEPASGAWGSVGSIEDDEDEPW